VDLWIWADVTVAARLAALVDSTVGLQGVSEECRRCHRLRPGRVVCNEVGLRRFGSMDMGKSNRSNVQLSPRLLFGTGGLHPPRRRFACLQCEGTDEARCEEDVEVAGLASPRCRTNATPRVPNSGLTCVGITLTLFGFTL
jgi:hypothetical protein